MVRRGLMTSVVLAVAIPGVANAKLSHSDAVSYGRAYAHVEHKFGVKAAGCKLIGPNATCHTKVTASRVLASTDVLHRFFAPPPAPPVSPATQSSTSVSTSGSYSSGGGYSSVPGVPAGFAACVATRESSNGAGSSNIYGIIPASGSNAGSGSLAEQKAAFAQLYAQYGTAPWAPYDGC